MLRISALLMEIDASLEEFVSSTKHRLPASLTIPIGLAFGTIRIRNVSILKPVHNFQKILNQTRHAVAGFRRALSIRKRKAVSKVAPNVQIKLLLINANGILTRLSHVNGMMANATLLFVEKLR